LRRNCTSWKKNCSISRVRWKFRRKISDNVRIGQKFGTVPWRSTKLTISSWLSLRTTEKRLKKCESSRSTRRLESAKPQFPRKARASAPRLDKTYR
jgi:hypothetical protein